MGESDESGPRNLPNEEIVGFRLSVKVDGNSRGRTI